MIAALPATKLVGLVIKTLAKPLSKRIQSECSRYDFSRKALIGIGQGMHRMQSRISIWSQGYQVLNIKDIDQEKALSHGAEFIGETFLLLVSGGWVLYEFNNSNEKARIKEENHIAETKAIQDDLQAKLKAIDVRLKALEDVVKSNSNSILSLGKQRYVAPDENELVSLLDRVQIDKQPSPNPKSQTDSKTSSASIPKNKVEKTGDASLDTKPAWWRRFWPS